MKTTNGNSVSRNSSSPKPGAIPDGDDLFEELPVMADNADDDEEEPEPLAKKPGGRDARKKRKEKNKGHKDTANHRP